MLTYALYVGRGGSQPIPLILLALAIIAVGAAVVRPAQPSFLVLRAPSALLVFGIALQFALLGAWPVTDPLALGTPEAYVPFWLGVTLAVAGAALFVLARAQYGLVAVVALVLVHLALGIWTIQTAPDPHIDLWVMQREGARALASGVNPYLPIYPNIHGTDTSYYGPGLVVNGELTIGFPYPPLSLLLVAPAELTVGDPRYAHLAAIELTALVLALARPGPLAIGAAILYLYNPWTFLMVAGAWTEPLTILLLALVVVAAVRAPPLVGITVGLLIGVKQYMLLALPLAALLLARTPRARWTVAWQAALVATAITIPFVVWDPAAFWWSTVGSLAAQVFRPDSLSFLAVLPGDWGPRLSVLAFVLLIPAGALVAAVAPRTPFGFAASLAFLLIVFFAFSRQGSGNYYFGIIGALCVALAAVPEVGRRSAGATATSPAPP
jgi:hypothetical protein